MRLIPLLLVAGMAAVCAAPSTVVAAPDADAPVADNDDVRQPARLQFRMFEPEETVVEAGSSELALPNEYSLGLFDGPPPENYISGRGLITTELVTGMFLNPTSGTLRQGSFSAQYCIGILRAGGGEHSYGHGGMLAYGLTDDIEVGLGGLLVDPHHNDSLFGAGGPFVRLRLTNDAGVVPEISVGGISRNGNKRLVRHTVFVAASKRFPIDEEGFFRSFRPHIGFRQFWQDSDVNAANASIFYAGGEIEIPLGLFVVGEISTKDGVFERTPYAIGMQWRPNETFGFSLAGIQNGGLDGISWYIGIGVDF
jgi:hypothetical protein